MRHVRLQLRKRQPVPSTGFARSLSLLPPTSPAPLRGRPRFVNARLCAPPHDRRGCAVVGEAQAVGWRKDSYSFCGNLQPLGFMGIDAEGSHAQREGVAS